MKKIIVLVITLMFTYYGFSQSDSLMSGRIKYSGNYRLANDTTAISRWGKVYVRRGKYWYYVFTCKEGKW